MIANLLKAASRLAILAAVIVAVFTLAADHRSDFGEVSLPGAGLVELPSGGVDVYYEEPPLGTTGSIVPGGVTFRVQPISGGSVISARGRVRAITVGDTGAITEIDVPTAGAYRATGRVETSQAGATLTFGQDASAAMARKADLWIGLIGGALVAALLGSFFGVAGRGGPAVDRPYDERPESVRVSSGTYYNG